MAFGQQRSNARIAFDGVSDDKVIRTDCGEMPHAPSRHVSLVPFVLAVTPVGAAGEPAAQPKTPVPDAEAKQTAKRAAGELFAERFQQAKTTAEKTALATDMMDAAAKVQAGSADQYVSLKTARDVVAGTGDAATALQAAERLLEQFDESAAKLTGETLLTAAREATTSAQHKAVAEAALSANDEAVRLLGSPP